MEWRPGIVFEDQCQYLRSCGLISIYVVSMKGILINDMAFSYLSFYTKENILRYVLRCSELTAHMVFEQNINITK